MLKEDSFESRIENCLGSVIGTVQDNIQTGIAYMPGTTFRGSTYEVRCVVARLPHSATHGVTPFTWIRCSDVAYAMLKCKHIPHAL